MKRGLLCLTLSLISAQVTAASWSVAAISGSPRIQVGTHATWRDLRSGDELADSAVLDVGIADSVTLMRSDGLRRDLRGVYHFIVSSLNRNMRSDIRSMRTHSHHDAVTVTGVRGAEQSPSSPSTSITNVVEELTTPPALWKAVERAVSEGDIARLESLLLAPTDLDTAFHRALRDIEIALRYPDPAMVSVAALFRYKLPVESGIIRSALPSIIAGHADAIPDQDGELRFLLSADGVAKLTNLAKIARTSPQKITEARADFIILKIEEWEDRHNDALTVDSGLSALEDSRFSASLIEDPFNRPFQFEIDNDGYRVHWSADRLLRKGNRWKQRLTALRARVNNDGHLFEQAIREFRETQGRIPEETEAFSVLPDSVPRTDPWGKPYTYTRDGDSYVIVTRLPTGEYMQYRGPWLALRVKGRGVTIVPGGVKFVVQWGEFDMTSPVYIAGDFNGWNATATPMNWRSSDKCWDITLTLTPGIHQYKFVRKGEWILDPENPRRENAEYGDNSAVEVPSL